MNAELRQPTGVYVDKDNHLYISDASGHCIRKVDAITSIITTVAGNGTFGYSGDGGLAVNANLRFPYDITVDNSSNLYIADRDNSRIRKVIIPCIPTISITSSANNICFGQAVSFSTTISNGGTAPFTNGRSIVSMQARTMPPLPLLP